VLTIVGLVGPFVLYAPAAAMFYLVAPFVLWQAWRMTIAIRRREEGRLVPGGAVLAFFAYVMVYGGILAGPVFATYGLSPRLAEARREAIAATQGCFDLAPVTTRYREPSLVFLTRTDLAMEDGAGAARFIAQGSCRIAFVASQDEPAFEQGLGAVAANVVLRERMNGVNLNGGRKLDIGVYVRGTQ
jgi:hypothetical protein